MSRKSRRRLGGVGSNRIQTGGERLACPDERGVTRCARLAGDPPAPGGQGRARHF